MKAPEDVKIVFVGTGAIGGSVGAWVSAVHANTYLLGRGAAGQAMRAHGITLYQSDRPEQKDNIAVRVLGSLDEARYADIVVVAVKLYDLESAAQAIQASLDDQALVLGLQNGVESQTVLPKYFSKAAYGVVGYNAWVDEPGVIGYQEKGPLVIGTPDNSLQDELRALAGIFTPGVETLVTTHLQDAMHSKLAINLANSVTTLVRRPDGADPGELDLYQDLLSNTIYEGVRVIQAAGYHEDPQTGMPSWRTLWAAAKLPKFITRGLFRRNLKRLGMSSMGQDVLLRKRTETELEYLNGYLLQLAEQQGVSVPYNRAIYRLSKAHFARPDFQPLSAREVWKEVQAEKARIP